MRVKIARNYNDSVTIERKWIFDAASLEATVQFTFTNSRLSGWLIVSYLRIKSVLAARRVIIEPLLHASMNNYQTPSRSCKSEVLKIVTRGGL